MKGDDKMAYTVYSQRMAGFLMLNGQVLVSMNENRKAPGKNVYHFKYSEEIERLMKDWKRDYSAYTNKGVETNNVYRHANISLRK